jgi:CDGSH-type Zn-finger protein
VENHPKMIAEAEQPIEKKIVVTEDGPYFVLGGVPLVRKIQVVSEYGEPLTWKNEGAWEKSECYVLCRCGNSHEKPFCDGTHCTAGFEGTETADPRPTSERQVSLPGSSGIIVKRDDSLCMEAGFCANRVAKIDDLVLTAYDLNVLSQVIAMVEHCPSGSLTCTLVPGEPDSEPELPEQVAVTTEITCDGPIPGSLWVTGGMPVERADGQPLERRNRVTLCCCGRSENKPLCDGKHRHLYLRSNMEFKPDASYEKFESLRLSYKPRDIRILFIGDHRKWDFFYH